MNTNENPYRSEDDQILARLRVDDLARRIERREEVLRERGNPTPLLGALMAEIVERPGVDSEEAVCDVCGASEIHDHPEEADEFCHWLDGRVDRADR